MPCFVLLLQDRDRVLNEISEESLISAVALEKIMRTCGFQFENKMKKSQALKELSNVVFIWLSSPLFLLENRRLKKMWIRKTCHDPDKKSSAKMGLLKQNSMQ